MNPGRLLPKIEPLKAFASDNYAGIHPRFIQAINEANFGHAKAYGSDPYTEEAIRLFKEQFGQNSDVYFVCNGTAANVLGLSALLKSYEAVICAESAHIHVDECGAIEKYIGCKLLTIPTTDGKLTPKQIQVFLSLRGDQHKVQPKVISITQTTEMGTVYTPEEIKTLTTFAHSHGLWVHMDGARICNAAAHLKMPFRNFTTDVGIDLLSFGGTKDGMMLGEAIVFLNKELSQDFKFLRKQGMQLVSKMRFISAQFIALLTDHLGIQNAQHANDMAEKLYLELRKIPEIKISKKVQANAIFALMDPKLISALQKHYYFYVWDETLSEVRLMTSWDTTQDDIDGFIRCISSVLNR